MQQQQQHGNTKHRKKGEHIKKLISISRRYKNEWENNENAWINLHHGILHINGSHIMYKSFRIIKYTLSQMNLRAESVFAPILPPILIQSHLFLLTLPHTHTHTYTFTFNWSVEQFWLNTLWSSIVYVRILKSAILFTLFFPSSGKYRAISEESVYIHSHLTKWKEKRRRMHTMNEKCALFIQTEQKDSKCSTI